MIKPTAIVYTQWDKKKRSEVPMMTVVVTRESTNANGRAGTIFADVASQLTADMAGMKGKDYEDMANELIRTDAVSSGGYGKNIEVYPYTGENIKRVQKMIDEIKKAKPEEKPVEKPAEKKK
jgi:hypothetical protein